jgi:hypothetical protein
LGLAISRVLIDASLCVQAKLHALSLEALAGQTISAIDHKVGSIPVCAPSPSFHVSVCASCPPV